MFVSCCFLLIYNFLVFRFVCVHAGREQVSALVENAIGGDLVGTLIRQPYGCGEQNIATMTLPVIAARYLDQTNQWAAVGFEKRKKALQHIQTGRLTDISFPSV